MARINETASESGERRKDVAARLSGFIKKIKGIDAKYLPKQKLYEESRREYNHGLAVWRKKVQDACITEKRWLDPEGKLQLSSYKRRLTDYRNAIRNLEFEHPRYRFKFKELTAKYADRIKLLDKYSGSLVEIRNNLKSDRRTYADLSADERWAYTLVSKLDLEHVALRYMKLQAGESLILKTVSNKKLVSRHKGENRLQIPHAEWNLFFKKVLESRRSRDYVDLTLAVCWFTGRRSTEVLKTAAFTPIDGSTVEFEGQLKMVAGDEKKIKIPVLADSKALVEALALIRRHKDFSKASTKQVNDGTASTLNKRLRDRLGTENVEVKSLRAIYGAYCHKYINRERDSSSVYIATILGHSKDDIDTVKSYDGILVLDESKTEIEVVEERSAQEKEVKAGLLAIVGKLDDKKKIKGRAMAKIHAAIKEMIETGETQFNMSRVYKFCGCNKYAIREYLEMAGLPEVA